MRIPAIRHFVNSVFTFEAGWVPEAAAIDQNTKSR